VTRIHAVIAVIAAIAVIGKGRQAARFGQSNSTTGASCNSAGAKAQYLEDLFTRL
jgi:hypothetical protein